jgi:hypothetical protein
MITLEQYEQAEREMTLREWRRGWRLHATVYAVVNAGLIALNVALIASTDASFVWFPFPLVGWGIGLTFHYLHGVRWAERDIRRRQQSIERHAEGVRKAA